MKSLSWLLFAFFGSLITFSINPLIGFIFIGYILYKFTAIGEEKKLKKQQKQAHKQAQRQTPRPSRLAGMAQSIKNELAEQMAPVQRQAPWHYSSYEEDRYEDRYEDKPHYDNRSPEERCPYNCRYGVRDCPMCNGRGAGMFDSYDVCRGCNDTGDVICHHR